MGDIITLFPTSANNADPFQGLVETMVSCKGWENGLGAVADRMINDPETLGGDFEQAGVEVLFPLYAELSALALSVGRMLDAARYEYFDINAGWSVLPSFKGVPTTLSASFSVVQDTDPFMVISALVVKSLERSPNTTDDVLGIVEKHNHPLYAQCLRTMEFIRRLQRQGARVTLTGRSLSLLNPAGVSDNRYYHHLSYDWSVGEKHRIMLFVALSADHFDIID